MTTAERLPDFLVIGSMKCGTTTLYFDLETSPGLYFPFEKEPSNLLSDHVLTPQGRAEYAHHFAKAPAGVRLGEATTSYTKVPEHPGVPERARRVLGPQLSLIYIVREPVARIISHHHHDLTWSRVGPDINEAVRTYTPLFDFTEYARQAEAWLEHFPREQLRIVRFEDYMRDRPAGCKALCDFLGVPARPDLVDAQKAFNKSERKPIHKGVWTKIYNAGLYRNVIRPIFPKRLKMWLSDRILPKAPPKAAPPTPDTVDFIYDKLADDHARLAALMGLPGPVWDRAKARAKHVETYERWKAEHAG